MKIYYLCTTKSDEKLKGREILLKKAIWRPSEGTEKIFVDHDQKG